MHRNYNYRRASQVRHNKNTNGILKLDAMYVRKGGDVMKKAASRMIALFLILTLVTTGLPQLTLSVTAAEKEQYTENEMDTKKSAEQQNDTASETPESPEHDLGTSSKEDDSAKKEST